MTQKRIEIARRRTKATTTFHCTGCNTGNHVYLLEGKLCPRCYQPEPVKAKRLDPHNKLGSKREQLPETLRLQSLCKEEVQRSGLPIYRFTRKHGLVSSTFDNWRRSVYGPKGQEAMNRKIRAIFEASTQAV